MPKYWRWHASAKGGAMGPPWEVGGRLPGRSPDQLGDLLLLGAAEGSGDRVRRRPHDAVVEPGRLLEAQRVVTGAVLVGGVEEDHHLAVGVRPGRLAVPGLRPELRRHLADDDLDP